MGRWEKLVLHSSQVGKLIIKENTGRLSEHLPAYKYSRTKAPVALTSKKTFGVRGCGLSQERFTWLPAVLKKTPMKR